METIFFLVFVGICAFAVVWVTRASKAKTDLALKNKRKNQVAGKLTTPLDSTLSHREEIWEKRRNLAAKGFVETQSFIPKSEAGAAPAYDGYSRRHRHHVGPTGVSKEKVHLEEKPEIAMTGVKSKNESQSVRR